MLETIIFVPDTFISVTEMQRSYQQTNRGHGHGLNQLPACILQVCGGHVNQQLPEEFLAYERLTATQAAVLASSERSCNMSMGWACSTVFVATGVLVVYADR